MVPTGLDGLVCEAFARLRGMPVGLVTHAAAVDRRFRPATDLLASAPGVDLVAVFGPEHGLSGQAQDLEAVTHAATAAPAESHITTGSTCLLLTLVFFRGLLTAMS